MTIPYALGDETPIPYDEIDWTLFNPDALDHVQAQVGRWSAAGGATADRLAMLLISWGNPELVTKPKSGQQVVDISSLAPARTQVNVTAEVLRGNREAAESARSLVVVSKQMANQATADFHAEIRSLYRAGATAGSLVEPSGLSLPRIHQIVSGARL